MKINNVYLFVTVVYNDVKSKSKTDWTFTHSQQFNGEIYFSDINGIISGVSSKTILNPNINNELWNSNVQQIFLFDLQTNNHKVYLTLCYVLNTNILHEFFFNTKSANKISLQKELLSELVIETFPDLEEMAKLYYEQNNASDNLTSEKRLPGYKLLLKNQFEANSSDIGYYIKSLDIFLVVVPSIDETQKLGDNEESKSDFLLRFEASINRIMTDMVYIPYYYLDFIETLAEHCSFKNSSIRVIVCTKPNNDLNIVIVPKSIKELINFEIKLNVLKEIKTSLSELYAIKDDIQNYIAMISDKNIFKNYATKFKNERLQYFQTKFEIEEVINLYKSTTPNSVPYNLKNYYDTFLIKNVSKSNELYSWSYLERKINEFDELVENIDYTLKTVEIKDSFINDYLNNVISVESSWTNLKLQIVLKRLTYAAILIAFLSVIVPLYPTGIKSLINDLFVIINNFIEKLLR